MTACSEDPTTNFATDLAALRQDVARLAETMGDLVRHQTRATGHRVSEATKGAMETLTRAWAAEFGPQGVRVNAISPGVVHEPAPGLTHPGDVLMAGTPAGRFGLPAEIAHAAVYLASEESAFVHGIVLDVDGGRTSAAVIAAQGA